MSIDRPRLSIGRSRVAYIGPALDLAPHRNATTTVAIAIDAPFRLGLGRERIGVEAAHEPQGGEAIDDEPAGEGIEREGGREPQVQRGRHGADAGQQRELARRLEAARQQRREQETLVVGRQKLRLPPQAL
jgi:hypothetical protein